MTFVDVHLQITAGSAERRHQHQGTVHIFGNFLAVWLGALDKKLAEAHCSLIFCAITAAPPAGRLDAPGLASALAHSTNVAEVRGRLPQRAVGTWPSDPLSSTTIPGGSSRSELPPPWVAISSICRTRRATGGCPPELKDLGHVALLRADCFCYAILAGTSTWIPSSPFVAT